MSSASSRLLEILACEESLYTFVKHAWPSVEGNNPFISSWHIQAICEHLEAATRREIPKLILNIPPRASKTTIISIMWPAWVWIKMPQVKFLFSSYAQKISWEHSRLCKMLIESPWYQERWGHIVKLSKDQVTKGHFTNTATGHRIATSVGAGGTALGGDILVCLPYDALVKTDIGDLKIGDIVERERPSMAVSYNHHDQKLEYKSIEKYEKRIAEEIYEIEFDDGSILECTGNHPIFTNMVLMGTESLDGFKEHALEAYVPAEELRAGDVVWCL